MGQLLPQKNVVWEILRLKTLSLRVSIQTEHVIVERYEVYIIMAEQIIGKGSRGFYNCFTVGFGNSAVKNHKNVFRGKGGRF